jgi:hypothetical protein
VGNNNPPASGINNDDIFIIVGDSIVQNGDLSFNNNAYLEINGILTITGDFTVNNNLDLVVNGKLYIQGDINVNNNADFTISGSGVMDVTGDVAFGNNTTGTIDGNLTVGGDFTIGGGTSSIGGTGSIDAPNSEICNDPAIDPADLSCTDQNGTLPVDVISFSAHHENNMVELSWITSSEENFNYFSLERSSDGYDFQEIGRIYSQSNYSVQLKTYQFVDEMPLEGYSYYRLKATDFDGYMEYHGIVSVRVNDINRKLTIFPNPSDGIAVGISYADRNKTGYKILDFSGHEIESGVLQTGINNIQFKQFLSPGIYFIYLEGSVKAEPVKLIIR